MKILIINCLNEEITSDIAQLYSEASFISLESLDKDLFDFINSNSPIETIDQVSTINSLMNIKHNFTKPQILYTEEEVKELVEKIRYPFNYKIRQEIKKLFNQNKKK